MSAYAQGDNDMWLQAPVEPVMESVSNVVEVVNRHSSKEMVAGVCLHGNLGVNLDLYPLQIAENYLLKYKGVNVNLYGAKITISSKPSHGQIQYYESGGDTADEIEASRMHGDIQYVASEIGIDSFAVRIEKDGFVVDVKYIVHILDKDEPGGELECEKGEWRISSASIGFLGRANVGVTWASPNYTNINVSFRDGVDQSLGLTVSNGAVANIKLDADAAGYGWYIDPLLITTTGNVDADLVSVIDMDD